MASHTTDRNTRPTTSPNDQQRQHTMARSSSAWWAVNSHSQSKALPAGDDPFWLPMTRSGGKQR